MKSNLNKKNRDVFAIILAAGKGSRMGAKINKMLLPLHNKTVLERACLAFENLEEIKGYVVCAAIDEIELIKNILNKKTFSKLMTVTAGGDSRMRSVHSGLMWLNNHDIDNEALVLIHDGARPLVSAEVILRCVTALQAEVCAVAAAVPVVDMIREVDDQGLILNSPDRSKLRAMQTPQGASLELLLASISAPQNNNFTAVDDATMMLEIGCPLRLVAGEETNIKITTPTDLHLAELILSNGDK